MEKAIRCEGLVKRFGDVMALRGVDLDVPQGVIYGFLGPNGAGKTTTIRLLTGLDRPTEGRVAVLGREIERGGLSLRQRMGYLDQHPQFYGWMSGRELLEFVGGLYGLGGSELRYRVDEVLDETGLTKAAKRRTGGYSGGMRQRLGLAQALINKPDVLFLDEPASSLDPAGRRDILDIIAGMRGRATVFMSTHILADVERVCDQVGIIDEGRLIVDSSLTNLQDRYAQPVYILEPEPMQDGKVSELTQSLRALPWVTSVTERRGEIRVIAGDTEAARKGLLPLVAQTGIALVRFERDHPSLEDIFLRLVGDDRGLEREVA